MCSHLDHEVWDKGGGANHNELLPSIGPLSPIENVSEGYAVLNKRGRAFSDTCTSRLSARRFGACTVGYGLMYRSALFSLGWGMIRTRHVNDSQTRGKVRWAGVLVKQPSTLDWRAGTCRKQHSTMVRKCTKDLRRTPGTRRVYQRESRHPRQVLGILGSGKGTVASCDEAETDGHW